jgi:hypothetical protein
MELNAHWIHVYQMDHAPQLQWMQIATMEDLAPGVNEYSHKMLTIFHFLLQKGTIAAWNLENALTFQTIRSVTMVWHAQLIGVIPMDFASTKPRFATMTHHVPSINAWNQPVP